MTNTKATVVCLTQSCVHEPTRHLVPPAIPKKEEESKMKRYVTRTLGVYLLIALAVTIAWAVAAKFHSAISFVNNDGALVVAFDERGLGTENIDYTLNANATALYACINKGGHNPDASNKQAFEGQVSGGATIEPKNGRVVASITIAPLAAPSFTCPGGQRRVLADVTYTSIVLTDTTNGTSTAVADASRVLVAIPD
jgi:hypothetical protein